MTEVPRLVDGLGRVTNIDPVIVFTQAALAKYGCWNVDSIAFFAMRTENAPLVFDSSKKPFTSGTKGVAVRYRHFVPPCRRSIVI